MNPFNPPNYPNEFNKKINKPYSYSDHIIRKPEKAEVVKRRRSIVVVDSKFRDKTRYPDPSDYTINFDEHYKYVTEVEMISYCIPRWPMYQISSSLSNNKILLMADAAGTTNIQSRDPPIKLDITLNDGDYTLIELADEIATQIIKKEPGIGLTTEYDDEKNSITIKNTANTTFIIEKAEIFNIDITTTENTLKVSPVFRTLQTLYPLNKCPYVMLKINPLRRYDSIDGNAAIRDSFALIPLGNDFKELLTTHNYGNVKYFNPPLPKLSQFKIKFMNPNTNQLWNIGKPVHRDHVMVFVITTLNQSGIYTDTLQ